MKRKFTWEKFYLKILKHLYLNYLEWVLDSRLAYCLVIFSSVPLAHVLSRQLEQKLSLELSANSLGFAELCLPSLKHLLFCFCDTLLFFLPFWLWSHFQIPFLYQDSHCNFLWISEFSSYLVPFPEVIICIHGFRVCVPSTPEHILLVQTL